MLVTQMWVRVSTTRSSLTAGCSADRVGHHGALVHLVQRRREVCGRDGLRCGAARPFGGDHGRGLVDPLLHEARPQGPELRAGGQRLRSGPGHRAVRAERGEERFDAVAPHPARVRRQAIAPRRRTRRRHRRSPARAATAAPPPWTGNRSRTSAATVPAPLARSSTEMSANERSSSSRSAVAGWPARGRRRTGARSGGPGRRGRS